MGAATKDFEERIAAFLNLRERFVVATNTGTSAFHIALLAAGVGPGDEVITPSFNYVADHQAVRMCGANPVTGTLSCPEGFTEVPMANVRWHDDVRCVATQYVCKAF